jgi:hypothetical protein
MIKLTQHTEQPQPEAHGKPRRADLKTCGAGVGLSLENPCSSVRDAKPAQAENSFGSKHSHKKCIIFFPYASCNLNIQDSFCTDCITTLGSISHIKVVISEGFKSTLIIKMEGNLRLSLELF